MRFFVFLVLVITIIAIEFVEKMAKKEKDKGVDGAYSTLYEVIDKVRTVVFGLLLIAVALFIVGWLLSNS